MKKKNQPKNPIKRAMDEKKRKETKFRDKR